MKVSVSFLSDSFTPKEIIKRVNMTDADFLHVDVMDGKFVNNKTYTLSELKTFNDLSNKKLDVHLMVSNPNKYVESLALLNTEYITFHLEAVKEPNELIDLIKNYGLKAGISINPKTNVSDILPYLGKIDQVLIMSVNPGKSGQAFIDAVLYKIETLKSEIQKNNYKVIISVDGGINEETATKVNESGADMVVSASFLHSDEMSKRIKLLKNI